MTDPFEQARWYVAYCESAIQLAPPGTPAERIEAWAWAMSLIADQFVDLRDGEEVEA